MKKLTRSTEFYARTLFSVSLPGVLALGLGSLPAGWLGDRWSREGMMKLFFFGMGAAALLSALASDPTQLALGVGAIGLFASIYHPVGTTALVFATSHKPGRALAINGLAGNLGLASAAAVTAFLTDNFGWQWAFITPGLCSIAMGLFYHWTTLKSAAHPIRKHALKTEKLNKNSMIRLFTGITVAASFGGLIFQSLTTSLPKILETSIDSNLTGIGSLATLMFTLAGLAVTASAAWYIAQPEPTVSLVKNKKRLFDLETHWDQGNVVALVRHAERCDRSDNQCLEGETGITVPGGAEAIKVGQKFKQYLPEQATTIYNSPVKRTDQTADLMFGKETSITQNWLREGCKINLYDDIFKYKKEGENLILVTHSTCIDKLGEAQNNDLVVMDIHDRSTYNSFIFLAVNTDKKEAYALGYLFADDWDKAFN